MKIGGKVKLELFSLALSDRPYLYIKPDIKQMFHYSPSTLLKVYDISTAKNGIGNREGSEMTPWGIHTIAEKIGNDEPIGMVFKNRKPTGEIHSFNQEGEDNLILTRILRLQGEESGINKGGNVDSYNRYIYIHGTDKENLIGIENMSHGCILMKNSDIVELFDKVEEGTVVIIDKPEEL